MKTIKPVSGTVIAAALAAIVFSGSASAFNIGSAQSEALYSCEKAMRYQLGLKRGELDKQYGMVQLDNKLFQMYFNVNKRTEDGGRKTIRVNCVSSGFANITSFDAQQGQWAFVSSPSETASDMMVSTSR